MKPTIKQQYDQAMAQLTAPGAPFELETRLIDGVEYRCFRHAPGTLLDVYRQAWSFGEREFLVYENERWTFNDLRRQASAIGQQLQRQLGIGKGDRVAIAMRNYPEWMSAYIAITAIGAVAVTINSWGQARELEYALTDAETRVVFCDQQRLESIAPRLPALGITAIVARTSSGILPQSAMALADFIAPAAGADLPAVTVQPEDLAMIMYTSGTTGNPKGAVSTHRAIGQSLAAFECSGYASAMSNPELMAVMMQKGHEPVQLLAVPLFHVSGCHAVFLLALKAGRKVVMMYKWDADKALSLIERERVTIASAAPTMVLQMLESERFAHTDTSSLFNIGGGGAATPPRVARVIREKFEHSYPGTGWGMTESNAIGTSFTGNAFLHKPGSAGFPAAIVDIKVCDDAGNELPQGQPGVLWLKSPSLVKGYWRKPEATASDFRDGWFNSGDIGYFDEEGYLFLSDRAKDMIIRAGENIAPAEIEAVLFNHPGVQEAVVLGVPDERMGEQVAACVRAQPGSNLDKDELRRFCGEHLAAFKVPYYVWIQDDEFPKNASGKVLKRHLRQQLQQDLGLVAD